MRYSFGDLIQYSFGDLIQNFELKRVGGTPNGYPLAPLGSSSHRPITSRLRTNWLSLLPMKTYMSLNFLKASLADAFPHCASYWLACLISSADLALALGGKNLIETTSTHRTRVLTNQNTKEHFDPPRNIYHQLSAYYSSELTASLNLTPLCPIADYIISPAFLFELHEYFL